MPRRRFRLGRNVRKSWRRFFTTSVSFDEEYGLWQREIDLDGEVFLNVVHAHEQDKPFVVHVRPPMAVRGLFSDSNGLTITAMAEHAMSKIPPKTGADGA